MATRGAGSRGTWIGSGCAAGADAIVSLPGGHDAGGYPVAPLDEALARAAIERQAARVSAFAVSASFGVRNPEHELQLRALVGQLCDKPVTCGHELVSSLGAPHRALTAALNARMVSHVKALIDAVRHTPAQHGIGAPLMMVQGDGTLVNAARALRRPVGTVLSGPAASVPGARIWARQMRRLYGLGTWVRGDAVAPARQLVDKVIATIHQKLIAAGLNDAGQMDENNAGKVARLLAMMAMQGASADVAGAGAAAADGAGGVNVAVNVAVAVAVAVVVAVVVAVAVAVAVAVDGAGVTGATMGAESAGPVASVFSLRFAPQMPLVAVGAPAPVYYPAAARGLGMVLVLPPHAEVANAVGAVLGRVSQRVHVAVPRPVRGVFRVFTPTGPRDFDSLSPAIALAQHLAGADALVQALDAGAAHAEVVLSQQDNRVDNDIDGNMFFESRVTATASGPPLRRAPTVARSNTQDASVACST